MKKHHFVTIYTSGTHYCELTRAYFRESGLEFEEINVRGSERMLDEVIKKSGQKETPITIIDGRTIVGYKPDLFEVILQQGE